MDVTIDRKLVYDPKTGRESIQIASEANKAKYAYNPIQLDLVPTATKIKNLNKVVKHQTQKIGTDKAT